jgi:soluble lytic murein transglycosylase-like protein
MMSRRQVALASALCLGLLPASAAPAAAELVYLASGRTLSVRGHRTEGESTVLFLRAGGELRCDSALIARIEPDEVPYPEPEEAVAQDANAPQAPLPSVPFSDLIDNLAATHGVDPRLVRAVVQVESAYQPRARSRKGALGLMQVMPATGRRYGAGNLFDPRTNLDAGIRHLKSLLQKFELTLALAAYNAGEEAVRRFNGVPPYRETRSYVSRILSLVKP